MQLPKMILFDYGHTLIAEPEFDMLRGYRALMPYITKNPQGLNAEDINRIDHALWQTVQGSMRKIHREVHEYQFLRLAFELLQIELSIPMEEQSRILYESSAGRYVPLPHMEELLALLRELGIRSGVVSNTAEAGDVMAARMRKYFPEHAFEFVVVSSEYAVRKPDPLIFQLALAKANLPPEAVWFCGDNPVCDIEGAYAVGMFPVWYTDTTMKNLFGVDGTPACPHLHISDWQELIRILKDLL